METQRLKQRSFPNILTDLISADHSAHLHISVQLWFCLIQWKSQTACCIQATGWLPSDSYRGPAPGDGV